MEVNDHGIIVSKRYYSESSVIVSIFSESHGIVRGLIKGALKSKTKHTLQLGNLVKFNKRSRLQEHLGYINIELLKSNLLNIMNSKIKLLITNTICLYLSDFLQENIPLKSFYSCTAKVLLEKINKDYYKYYILWELQLLANIGFGLDLQKCAVTNSTTNLYYISPKTGKVVTKEVGDPYKDKLFKVPDFIINDNLTYTMKDIYDMLNITQYFLNRFVNEYGKSIPKQREMIVNKVLQLI